MEWFIDKCTPVTSGLSISCDVIDGKLSLYMVDDVTGTILADPVNAAIDSIRSSMTSDDFVSSHPAIISVTFLEKSDDIDPQS